MLWAHVRYKCLTNTLLHYKPGWTQYRNESAFTVPALNPIPPLSPNWDQLNIERKCLRCICIQPCFPHYQIRVSLMQD